MNTSPNSIQKLSPTHTMAGLNNPILKTDSYKESHGPFYPEGTTHVVRPHELNAFACEKKATLLGLVPAVLDIFLESSLPASLSHVGVGGAAVTAELCLRVAAAQSKRKEKGFLLTTGYSGTEQGDVTNIRMRSLEDVQDAAGLRSLGPLEGLNSKNDKK